MTHNKSKSSITASNKDSKCNSEIAERTQKIISQVVALSTTISNDFPQGPAFDMYCASHPTFKKSAANLSERVKNLIQKMGEQMIGIDSKSMTIRSLTNSVSNHCLQSIDQCLGLKSKSKINELSDEEMQILADMIAKEREKLKIICNSTEGCFTFNDETQQSKSSVMISKHQKSVQENKDFFFPNYSSSETLKTMNENMTEFEMFELQNAQKVVEEIMNDMNKEPIVAQLMYHSKCLLKKKKKQKQKKKRNASSNYPQTFISAVSRHKIIGSTVVDVNSTKDVFKLPRKRKLKEMEENAGSIMDSLQMEMGVDIKRKRIEVQQKRIESDERRIADNNNSKYMRQIIFPEKRMRVNLERDDEKKQRLQIIKDLNSNNLERNVDFEQSVNDLLDSAPVPVMDAEFEEVYDPNRTLLQED